MTFPMLGALAELSDLSAEQQRGVIETLAQLDPELLVGFAERDDLTANTLGCLVSTAPVHVLPRILERVTLDLAMLDRAVEAHGVTPDLVVLCAQHGWLDHAIDLAQRIHSRDVESLAHRWTRVIGEELPDQLRCALVHAALAETEPRPNLTGMSEWDRDKALERLRAQRQARDELAWRLLEPAPNLWLDLVRDGEDAVLVRRILLGRAAALPDEVLLACLPEITSDALRERDAETFAGIRLCSAARHAKRWPRLRELIPEQLDRVLREAVEDGWTPSKHSWHEITALAELSDDAALLTDAVGALRAENPWLRNPSHRDWAEQWGPERAEAAAALAANPNTPREVLIDVLPALDEQALQQILQHTTGPVSEAADEQLTSLRQAAAAREPKIVKVPDDDELAQLPDPVEELRKHLRHLRGRVKQRDATCDALLRSRFTTDELLRALPANRVLQSAEQSERVANMIKDACGDHPERWAALPTHCQPPSGTFGQWLDRLTTIS